MADNLGFTPGSGATVATDDVSSVHYQKMKIALGRDGVVSDLLDFGPVSLASSDSAPVSASGDTTMIAAPGTGLKLRVLYVMLQNTSETEVRVSLKDGAAGAKRFPVTLPRYGVFAHNLRPDWWDLTNETALVLNCDVAGAVDYHIEYKTI
jgi:hypothetical protein